MESTIKKVISINLGNFGSTGKIMEGISNTAKELKEYDVYFAIPGNKNNHKCNNCILICSELQRKIAEKLAYYTGYRGIWMVFSTFKLLRKIDEIRPSIIHLHNLHDTYINLPMLFRYIKKNNIRIIWTLHDCWAFTGQCPHFTIAHCEKWKSGCYKCPQFGEYPAANCDKTSKMWEMKKKWFTGVANLTIVTPSKWLAELVKQSYLKEYPIQVINNGIDNSIFSPRESNFREKYNIGKYMLLGVAFDWSFKKGIDVFIELRKRLSNEYSIVVVGTNNKIDELLPEGIISIHRTHNQLELSEIYSSADLFINPTREENYPTVNMESISCGTPVITFNTGGSSEIVGDCGLVIDVDDINAMEKAIVELCGKKSFIQNICLKKAKKFNQNDRYREYCELYDKE